MTTAPDPSSGMNGPAARPAADPCVAGAGYLCINIQARTLCRGCTPHDQEAADTLVGL